MAKEPELEQSRNVLSILQEVERLKHTQVQGQGLDPKMAVLRAWQSQRLATTYADLKTSPRYGPACGFFLGELYGARDFSQRDHDIEQMYAFMQRVFPASLIRPLKVTVELHRLTQSLDEHLLEVLVNQLGMAEAVTEDSYAEAYRQCDNYVERVRQIDQIYKIGIMLDEIMQRPVTRAAMAIAKTPARRAGWNELTDFLEAGYKAFTNMRGAEYFLKTIRQREKLILDRIYAAEPNPFAI